MSAGGAELGVPKGAPARKPRPKEGESRAASPSHLWRPGPGTGSSGLPGKGSGCGLVVIFKTKLRLCGPPGKFITRPLLSRAFIPTAAAGGKPGQGDSGWSQMCPELAVGHRSVTEPLRLASLTELPRPALQPTSWPIKGLRLHVLRGLLSVIGQIETKHGTPECFLPPRFSPQGQENAGLSPRLVKPLIPGQLLPLQF